MAKLNINGQEVVLPRYNLNIMAVAGPHMDAIFKTMEGGEMPTNFAALNALVANLTGFIAAGASRVQPELTQERLGEVYSIADADILQKVVEGIFAELGVDVRGNPLPRPAAAAAADQTSDIAA
jgi:hypothetical protein